jgi:hypothetical protein
MPDRGAIEDDNAEWLSFPTAGGRNEANTVLDEFADAGR